MNWIKKLKQQLKNGKDHADALNKATKIRFQPAKLEQQILYGTGLTKGLLSNKRYLRLSEEGRRCALMIVHEECSRKPEYKGKELPGIARRIEKRLKNECKQGVKA